MDKESLEKFKAEREEKRKKAKAEEKERYQKYVEESKPKLIEFKKELKELLTKYDASIDVLYSDCSDTYGMYDTEMGVSFGNKGTIPISGGWGLDKSDF